LMNIGWKSFLPLSIVNLFLVAVGAYIYWILMRGA